MKNKLLAQICKAIVISVILSTAAFTWRFLIGPTNDNLSIIIAFVRNINAVIIHLCFMEIIAFRVLLVFAWKHFNSTNDEFIFFFVNVFNTYFAFTTQISRWLLGKYNQNLKFGINRFFVFDIKTCVYFIDGTYFPFFNFISITYTISFIRVI